MKAKTKKAALILTASIILLVIYSCSEKPIAQYHMINVNQKTQGDAHYIKIEDKNILIDTGVLSEAEASLVPYLKDNGISTIDMLIVSHLHKDHYQGLKPILKAGIKISSALFSIPDQKVCERDCCCDWDQAMAYIDYLKAHGVQIISIEEGTQKKLSENSDLIVLHAQKTGQYDINDTSIIILWKIGEFRVLFTGDLNKKLSRQLKDHPEIRADILKVPHHGTEGLAINAFIKNVHAKVMMIPSPDFLWKSKRSKRIRTFKYKNGEAPIKLVNGIDGHIQIDFYADKINISTESGRRLTLPQTYFQK